MPSMSEPAGEELLERIAESEKQSGSGKIGELEFRVGALFPSIKTDEFRVLQDVSLHCLLKLRLRGARFQSQ